MDYPAADHGKCRFCGFLSKHAQQTSGLPSPRFYEAEHSERISPSLLFHHTAGYGLGGSTEPMCFMQKINLMQTYEQEGAEKLSQAINFDRRCDAWYPYMPGFDPKEHYERLQMQRLEQDRREFEAKLADMALTAEQKSAAIATQSAEIARESKQLVADLKVIAQNSDRFTRRVTLWIIILAVAQVLVAVLFYLFPHESYTDQLLRKLFG